MAVTLYCPVLTLAHFVTSPVRSKEQEENTSLLVGFVNVSCAGFVTEHEVAWIEVLLNPKLNWFVLIWTHMKTHPSSITTLLQTYCTIVSKAEGHRGSMASTIDDKHGALAFPVPYSTNTFTSETSVCSHVGSLDNAAVRHLVSVFSARCASIILAYVKSFLVTCSFNKLKELKQNWSELLSLLNSNKLTLLKCLSAHLCVLRGGSTSPFMFLMFLPFLLCWSVFKDFLDRLFLISLCKDTQWCCCTDPWGQFVNLTKIKLVIFRFVLSSNIVQCNCPAFKTEWFCSSL